MAIDRTKKVSEFARISRAGTDDLLLLVNDPEGTPSTRTITIKNLYNDVGAEAIFYANTTHKANVHFQSNTLFTGNDNRFQSNVHLTSNLYIGTGVSMSAFGRTYSGSNPAIANDEFQSFVANTNEFILTLQETGTFLLPNGSFAVANLSYQTDLANTNTRLLGLEAYGQLASNLHVINTYVANTVFQGALANTNVAVAADRARLNTLETKMANQESLTANGFVEATATAISNSIQYTDQTIDAFRIEMNSSYLDIGYFRINDFLTDQTNNSVYTIGRAIDGQNAILQDGVFTSTPSPTIGWRTEVNANNKIRLYGASVAPTENQTIYLYKGFTYKFASITNNRNVEIKNSDGSPFTNGVYSNTLPRFANTSYYANNSVITTFTVPMAQESNLRYQDSANSQIYGTIVIR